MGYRQGRNSEQLFPYGIYTIPEVSMIGKTEAQLTADEIPYEVRPEQNHLDLDLDLNLDLDLEHDLDLDLDLDPCASLSKLLGLEESHGQRGA